MYSTEKVTKVTTFYLFLSVTFERSIYIIRQFYHWRIQRKPFDKNRKAFIFSLGAYIKLSSPISRCAYRLFPGMLCGKQMHYTYQNVFVL